MESNAHSKQDPDGYGDQLLGVSRAAPLFVQVARQLITAIESGQFPVGSRLPSENELAKIFDVSRPSVREALSCLQFEGYLEPRRGSGTVVISSVERGSRSYRRSKPGSNHDPIDVIEARLAVEPVVLGLAAADPVRKELDNVLRILGGMQLSLSEPEMHAHSDLVVHTTLIRVCKNKVLVELAEGLLSLGEDAIVRSARDKAWKDDRLPSEWLGHHESIARAVLARDPERATASCTVHLLSVLEQIENSTRLTAPGRARIEALKKKYP